MEKENQVFPREYNGQPAVTPIFLVTIDQNGNVIDPALVKAVEDQHGALCGLAKRFLGDATRVSDLAQAAINRVWARPSRGKDLGKHPNILIYGAARLIARAWRHREHEEARRWESLETGTSTRRAGATRATIENEYIEAIDGNAAIAEMMKGFSVTDRRIIDLHLLGLNYIEIVAALRNEYGISHPRRSVRGVIDRLRRRARTIT